MSIPQEVESLLDLLNVAVPAPGPHRLRVEVSVFGCKATHPQSQSGSLGHNSKCLGMVQQITDDYLGTALESTLTRAVFPKPIVAK